jgi:hypothetical protein
VFIWLIENKDSGDNGDFYDGITKKWRKLTKVKTHPVEATPDIPLFNFVGKRGLNKV